MTTPIRRRIARLFPFAALAASPLAAQSYPPEATPAGAAPPPATNLGWVMAANLVIWGGIAIYVILLHRKASRLEKGE